MCKVYAIFPTDMTDHCLCCNKRSGIALSLCLSIPRSIDESRKGLRYRVSPLQVDILRSMEKLLCSLMPVCLKDSIRDGRMWKHVVSHPKGLEIYTVLSTASIISCVLNGLCGETKLCHFTSPTSTW